MNYIAAFAYFKNFFDRITADLEYEFNDKSGLKEPNYRKFYKSSELIKFYNMIENSEITIKNAQKYRNANPLAHASSELLDSDSTSADLQQIILDLTKLIYKYIENRFKT